MVVVADVTREDVDRRLPECCHPASLQQRSIAVNTSHILLSSPPSLPPPPPPPPPPPSSHRARTRLERMGIAADDVATEELKELGFEQLLQLKQRSPLHRSSAIKVQHQSLPCSPPQARRRSIQMNHTLSINSPALSTRA